MTGTFDVTITADEVGSFSYTGGGGTPQVIYSEDFSGQNGTGWNGNSGTLPPFSSNLSSVDWTMDISNASLSGVSDYFKIYYEKLAARDVDGIVLP